jgi:hypothetical protein
VVVDGSVVVVGVVEDDDGGLASIVSLSVAELLLSFGSVTPAGAATAAIPKSRSGAAAHHWFASNVAN